MPLPSKTQAQMLADLVTGWQLSTGIAAQFQDGDYLLAFFQACNVQLNFLQALDQQIVLFGRASTSTGSDLDSWFADFGYVRPAASFASGKVTASKLSPATSAISVNVGTIVQTPDAAIQYAVIADTNRLYWNVAAGKYILPVGGTAMDMTVQATALGTGSNVAANQLSAFGTQVAGLDAVTNPAPISNGYNAMSDVLARASFVTYIQNLGLGTKGAILNAVNSVQQGLSVIALENQNVTGIYEPATFVLIVDDGSGSPPSGLIANIYTAVNRVRAFTIQPIVVPPQLMPLAIGLTIHVSAGFVAATVATAAQLAVVNAVDSITTGFPVYISFVEAAALAVSGVASVQPGGTSINGFALDLAMGLAQRPTTSSGLVTVGTY